MASFSPTEAAFTGFRVVREHPRAVLGWALLQLAISLSTSLLMVATAGPSFARLQGMGFQTNANPAETMALLQQLLPAYAGILIISLLFYPVLYAAMNRAVLKPDEGRFGYLLLGADELRQLGLAVLFVLVGLAAYIGLIVIAVLVAVAFTLVLGSAGKAAAGAIAFATLFICLFLGMVFFGVRLSLASPLTFATGRINLFGSWTLTRGRFWPIFGTYVLAFATSAVVGALGFVVIAAVMSLVAGGITGMSAVLRPNLSSLSAFLTPAELVYIALSAILNALIWPLLLTPPAAIYQSLAASHGLPGGSQPPLEEVFS